MINKSYVYGVFDENGNEVIRPLTKEEREFYNKFNNEFEKGFLSTPDLLHSEMIEERKETIEDLLIKKESLKEQIKKLSATGFTKSSGEKRLKIKNEKMDRDEKIRELTNSLRELNESIEEMDVKKNINRKRYARRNDPMSRPNFRDYSVEFEQIEDLEDDYYLLDNEELKFDPT